MQSLLRHTLDGIVPQSRKAVSTGLFGYNYLKKPSDLIAATTLCIEQATQLVQLVCQDSQLNLVVKRVDRISDILCSVIDASEMIRNVHPHPEWIEAASQSYVSLHNFLNQLNTHQGLYHVKGYNIGPW